MEYRLEDILSEKDVNDLLMLKLELALLEADNENIKALKEVFVFDRTE